MRLRKENNMAEILKFPGFIIPRDDRSTTLKDGKRYKSMKALISDLNQDDLRRTYEWRIRWYIGLRGWQSGPEDRHAAGILDSRARMLRQALYGDTPRRYGDAA